MGIFIFIFIFAPIISLFSEKRIYRFQWVSKPRMCACSIMGGGCEHNYGKYEIFILINGMRNFFSDKSPTT